MSSLMWGAERARRRGPPDPARFASLMRSIGYVRTDDGRDPVFSAIYRHRETGDHLYRVTRGEDLGAAQLRIIDERLRAQLNPAPALFRERESQGDEVG